MADTIQLDVIAPDELVLSEVVDTVVVPGISGEFGVLPGHTPMVSVLAPGELKYTQGDTEKTLIIWGGLVEVRDARVRVLADTVEYPGHIDAEAAKAELSALEDKLRSFDGEFTELLELTKGIKLAEFRARARV